MEFREYPEMQALEEELRDKVIVEGQFSEPMYGWKMSWNI